MPTPDQNIRLQEASEAVQSIRLELGWLQANSYTPQQISSVRASLVQALAAQEQLERAVFGD